MVQMGFHVRVIHGRHAELAQIEALLAGARERRSAALVILGEPGAGKSSLLAEARDMAREMTVLEGQGLEAEATLPYAGLHQLLRRALPLLDSLPADQSQALRAALGMLEVPASDIYRVPLAVLSLLAEAAEHGPVLVLVDDLQWLDPDSRQALVFAARRLHAEGVVVLCAARDGTFDPGPLPALHLEPLGARAVAQLMEVRRGCSVAADVGRRIAVATGGNPLAVVELAALLTPAQLAGRHPLPSPLPLSAGVERLFAEQAAALPESTRRLALVAAADDTARVEVVLGAARRLGVGLTALAPAEQGGLLRVTGSELRFRHPLQRSAVYHLAPLVERREAHRALAEELHQAGDIDRHAWHLASAAVGPDDEAVARLEQAAYRARDRHAFAAAAAAFERAADLSASPQERGRRLAEAATDAWQTGLLPQAARLIGAAELLVDDPLVLANCQRLRGSIELAVGTSPTAVRLLSTGALRLAPIDPRRALELLALAAEGASLASDVEAAREIGRLASSLDVDRAGAKAHFFSELLVGFARVLEGDGRRGFAAIRLAIARAEDEFEDVDLLLAAGRAALYTGADAAAVRFHERIVARARKIGSVGCLAIGGARLALAQALVGSWSSAVAMATEASRLAEDTGQAELQTQALAWRALVAAWRGEQDGGDAGTSRAAGSAASPSMGFVEDSRKWAMAARELTRGRPGHALARLETLTHPIVVASASLDAFDAAVDAEQRDRAERWRERVRTYAEDSGAAWAAARLSYAHARMSDDADTAEARFREALVSVDGDGRPFERARIALAYGTFLRRRRRRVDARAQLRAALEVFDALEARPWADRATRELRASGETARRRGSAAPDGLTPQERQVAGFVARGLSNREVAAQLFLSPRTIDFHLRNIYTKLEIASRTELAGLLLAAPADAPRAAEPV